MRCLRSAFYSLNIFLWNILLTNLKCSIWEVKLLSWWSGKEVRLIVLGITINLFTDLSQCARVAWLSIKSLRKYTDHGELEVVQHRFQSEYLMAKKRLTPLFCLYRPLPSDCYSSHCYPAARGQAVSTHAIWWSLRKR